jgi:hypothetical protein
LVGNSEIVTVANDKGQSEQAAERHVRAFELRKAGASYRQIGRKLGVSGKTAYEDVQRVLAELAEMRLASAADYVALELERLDAAQLALYQHLETGDPQIVNAWVKVSESRRKLLGLDAQPGTVPTGTLDIILRWHDDNRRIIDITPAADDHAAPAPQLATDSSAAPGALPYRVRWATMGEEPPCGDAEPENSA